LLISESQTTVNGTDGCQYSLNYDAPIEFLASRTAASRLSWVDILSYDDRRAATRKAI